MPSSVVSEPRRTSVKIQLPSLFSKQLKQCYVELSQLSIHEVVNCMLSLVASTSALVQHLPLFNLQKPNSSSGVAPVNLASSRIGSTIALSRNSPSPSGSAEMMQKNPPLSHLVHANFRFVSSLCQLVFVEAMVKVRKQSQLLLFPLLAHVLTLLGFWATKYFTVDFTFASMSLAKAVGTSQPGKKPQYVSRSAFTCCLPGPTFLNWGRWLLTVAERVLRGAELAG